MSIFGFENVENEAESGLYSSEMVCFRQNSVWN